MATLTQRIFFSKKGSYIGDVDRIVALTTAEQGPLQGTAKLSALRAFTNIQTPFSRGCPTESIHSTKNSHWLSIEKAGSIFELVT